MINYGETNNLYTNKKTNETNSMKILTKQVLKDLDGKPIPKLGGGALTLGIAIAQMLTNREAKTGFDPLKTYILATKFYDNDEVDIDDADWMKVKKLLESNTADSALVVGQVLKILNQIGIKDPSGTASKEPKKEEPTKKPKSSNTK